MAFTFFSGHFGCNFFVLPDEVVTWIEEDWEHNLAHLFECTLLFLISETYYHVKSKISTVGFEWAELWPKFSKDFKLLSEICTMKNARSKLFKYFLP